MRKLTAAILAIGALIVVPSTSQAQGIGPVCFKTDLFANVWKVFFIPTGGNQFIGSGEDLSANRPLTASLYLTPTTAMVGLITIIPPTGSGHSSFITGSLSLATTTGPGRCEAVNNATTGCGTGIPINLSVVACPVDDRLSAEALAGPKIDGR